MIIHITSNNICITGILTHYSETCLMLLLDGKAIVSTYTEIDLKKCMKKKI
jgi:hypothetical protein